VTKLLRGTTLIPGFPARHSACVTCINVPGYACTRRTLPPDCSSVKSQNPPFWKKLSAPHFFSLSVELVSGRVLANSRNSHLRCIWIMFFSGFFYYSAVLADRQEKFSIFRLF